MSLSVYNKIGKNIVKFSNNIATCLSKKSCHVTLPLVKYYCKSKTDRSNNVNDVVYPKINCLFYEEVSLNNLIITNEYSFFYCILESEVKLEVLNKDNKTEVLGSEEFNDFKQVMKRLNVDLKSAKSFYQNFMNYITSFNTEIISISKPNEIYILEVKNNLVEISHYQCALNHQILLFIKLTPKPYLLFNNKEEDGFYKYIKATNKTLFEGVQEYSIIDWKKNHIKSSEHSNFYNEVNSFFTNNTSINNKISSLPFLNGCSFLIFYRLHIIYSRCISRENTKNIKGYVLERLIIDAFKNGNEKKINLKFSSGESTFFTIPPNLKPNYFQKINKIPKINNSIGIPVFSLSYWDGHIIIGNTVIIFQTSTSSLCCHDKDDLIRKSFEGKNRMMSEYCSNITGEECKASIENGELKVACKSFKFKFFYFTTSKFPIKFKKFSNLHIINDLSSIHSLGIRQYLLDNLKNLE